MKMFSKLYSPISSKSLGIFRIVFGVLFLIHLLYYSKSAYFRHYFIDTTFHFKFQTFSFIEPLGEIPMLVLHYLTIIFAILFLIGYFYRIAAIGLFLILTYFELIDVAYHNNHNYVIILFLLFFSISGANRSYSIDRRVKNLDQIIPIWNEWIFKFQIFIVYFFGGIAKINSDWIDGSIMQELLSHSFPNTPVSSLSGYAHFSSIAGLGYDLLIVPLLLWKKTRWPALILVLMFNFSNAYLFSIGVFPFLMIGACLFFFTDKFSISTTSSLPTLKQNKIVNVFLLMFALFQVLIPLRHYFIKGNVHWTGEGYFLAWQMKSFTKESQMEFMLLDATTKDQYVIPINDVLLPEQIQRMSYFPKLARQFALFLKEDAKRKNIHNVQVYTLFGTSLNGKPSEVVIDQDVDLTTVEENPFGHSDWINLLQQ